VIYKHRRADSQMFNTNTNISIEERLNFQISCIRICEAIFFDRPSTSPKAVEPPHPFRTEVQNKFREKKGKGYRLGANNLTCKYFALAAPVLRTIPANALSSFKTRFAGVSISKTCKPRCKTNQGLTQLSILYKNT
jgi:hypothetical protein